MIFLDKPYLIILVPAIALFLFQYLGGWKIILDVNKGKPPRKLKDFPSIETSEVDYKQVQYKIRSFCDSALKNKTIELSLNEFEINTLAVKGSLLNKYIPGEYFYYQIKEDSIIEKMIIWPFLSAKGYKYRERWIYFVTKTQLWERTQVFDGTLMEPYEKTLPISYSSLIVFVLGGSKTSASLTLNAKQTVKYQQALNIIEKLRNVEIKQGFLILET